MAKPQLPNLQQTVANTILITNISISTKSNVKILTKPCAQSLDKNLIE